MRKEIEEFTREKNAMRDWNISMKLFGYYHIREQGCCTPVLDRFIFKTQNISKQ